MADCATDFLYDPSIDWRVELLALYSIHVRDNYPEEDAENDITGMYIFIQHGHGHPTDFGSLYICEPFEFGCYGYMSELVRFCIEDIDSVLRAVDSDEKQIVSGPRELGALPSLCLYLRVHIAVAISACAICYRTGWTS